jgi:PTH1 family peptidyl-tRNA hydrolase
MIKFAVFLGNPGPEYKMTRHNAGFLAADFLLPGADWVNKTSHYLYKTPQGLNCIKPLVFMNLSGGPVGELARFFKWNPSEILVIHDEIEMDCGEVKVAKGGGLKGHNGLRSIEKNLSSSDFWRVKIGIGRPSRGDVASWVLSKFSKDDEQKIEGAFYKISAAWDKIIAANITGTL